MRAVDFQIPYRLALGIIIGNAGGGITEQKLFGINSVASFAGEEGFGILNPRLFGENALFQPV